MHGFDKARNILIDLLLVEDIGLRVNGNNLTTIVPWKGNSCDSAVWAQS